MGVPAIPRIVRACQFEEDGVACGTEREFVGKPWGDMPGCLNESFLDHHLFVW